MCAMYYYFTCSKSSQTDPNKPLFVTAGQDTFQQIGKTYMALLLISILCMNDVTLPDISHHCLEIVITRVS